MAGAREAAGGSVSTFTEGLGHAVGNVKRVVVTVVDVGASTAPSSQR